MGLFFSIKFASIIFIRIFAPVEFIMKQLSGIRNRIVEVYSDLPYIFFLKIIIFFFGGIKIMCIFALTLIKQHDINKSNPQNTF